MPYPYNPYAQPPVMAQQQPQGPQMPLQWLQMPGADQQQMGQDAGAAAGGLDALLKRFKKAPTMTDSPMPEGFGGALGGGGMTA